MDRPEQLQLHLALPYRQQPRDHPRIRALLEDGYVIAELHRISDKEVLVTLRLSSPVSS